MSNENKINIFDVLNHIDSGDIYYYDNLTDEQKNSISMFMLCQWMTCMNNQQQLKAVEAIVNPYIFSLHKHKTLLYKLMVIASSGTKKNYKWNYKKKKKSTSASVSIISEYHDLSNKHAEEYINMFKKEDIIDMAMELGYDDNYLKKIKKEYE